MAEAFRTRIGWAATALLVAAVGGCSDEPADTSAPAAASSSPSDQPPRERSRPSPSATATEQSRPPAPEESSAAPEPDPRRVLVISVDGLNPDAFDVARTPNFDYLQRTGASTLNARTTVEQTNTLPNHTSMMTGVPVGGPLGHRVTFNSDNGSSLTTTAGRYVPGIFDVAHDHGRSTALYTSKDKFQVLRRAWDGAAGAPDEVGADDGRDKLDTFLLAPTDVLVDRACAALVRDRTDLTFLHLALPDAAGHQHGFMSRRYLDAVRQTDALLGRVLRTVQEDPVLRRSTVVVLTADHGGEGPRGHGNARDQVNYTVPFYAWGVGVAPGTDLYDLNDARTDPGGSRPGYDDDQPVRNLDVPDLALSLMGLPLLDDGRDLPPLRVAPS